MSRFSPKNKSFWLAQLSESNYQKLCELVPQLPELSGNAIAFSYGKPALHLTLLERSKYTLTVELNYWFDGGPTRTTEPRIRIRIYLDGKCAEALNGAALVHSVTHASRRQTRFEDVLDDKWSSNYFLERWLNHCLLSQYRFECRLPPARSPAFA